MCRCPQLNALEAQLNEDAHCDVEGWLLLALHRLPRAGDSATAVLNAVGVSFELVICLCGLRIFVLYCRFCSIPYFVKFCACHFTALVDGRDFFPGRRGPTAK